MNATVLDTIAGQKLLGQPTNNALGVEALGDANQDFSGDNAADIPPIFQMTVTAPRTITLMAASSCPGKWLIVQAIGNTVQVVGAGTPIPAGDTGIYFSNGTSWLKMGVLPS